VKPSKKSRSCGYSRSTAVRCAAATCANGLQHRSEHLPVRQVTQRAENGVRQYVLTAIDRCTNSRIEFAGQDSEHADIISPRLLSRQWPG
jgi:hypothetical protein